MGKGIDKKDELSQEEKNGIVEIINYVISKRVIDKATSLSYMELIEIKNKLYE